jgi:hypothetical protein
MRKATVAITVLASGLLAGCINPIGCFAGNQPGTLFDHSLQATVRRWQDKPTEIAARIFYGVRLPCDGDAWQGYGRKADLQVTRSGQVVAGDAGFQITTSPPIPQRFTFTDHPPDQRPVYQVTGRYEGRPLQGSITLSLNLSNLPAMDFPSVRVDDAASPTTTVYWEPAPVNVQYYHLFVTPLKADGSPDTGARDIRFETRVRSYQFGAPFPAETKEGDGAGPGAPLTLTAGRRYRLEVAAETTTSQETIVVDPQRGESISQGTAITWQNVSKPLDLQL